MSGGARLCHLRSFSDTKCSVVSRLETERGLRGRLTEWNEYERTSVELSKGDSLFFAIKGGRLFYYLL